MASTRRSWISWQTAIIFASLPLLSACMSFRSDLQGSDPNRPPRPGSAEPVTVFFRFTHLEQERGFDVVPKIVQPQRGFRDIFGESMKRLSKVRSFATFTDSDNDIDNVQRRSLKDSLAAASGVTIHLTFRRENSFAKHFLASLCSYGTIAVIPMAYSWEYIVTADVRNSTGVTIASYRRTSSLTTWFQTLLVFVYPFFPSEMKIEEIYLESMQSIFAQMESEGVLSR